MGGLGGGKKMILCQNGRQKTKCFANSFYIGPSLFTAPGHVLFKRFDD